MNAIATKTTYTPAELLEHPDEKDYELVDGRLVVRHMSTLSSWVAGRLFRYLDTHVEEHQLGWAFCEGTGYQCFPDLPNKVRKPDASFIRGDRLPPHVSKGYLRIAPDLAVEVISQNDSAWDLDLKVADYLAIGVPLVWVVHPLANAVRVHRAGGTVGWFGAQDELSGEGILPGFRCRVGALFPPWAEFDEVPSDA